MLLHESTIYIFGGVRSLKKQNNSHVPEFLNDLWKYSLIDKIWKRIDVRMLVSVRQMEFNLSLGIDIRV